MLVAFVSAMMPSISPRATFSITLVTGAAMDAAAAEEAFRDSSVFIGEIVQPLQSCLRTLPRSTRRAVDGRATTAWDGRRPTRAPSPSTPPAVAP